VITVIARDSILEGFDDFRLTVNKKSSENSRHRSNLLLDATQSIDCYLSQLSKSQGTLSNSLFEYLRAIDKNKKNKISVRVVTSINPDNIELAKELARKFTVYHTDASGGDFCIIDVAMYFYDIEVSSHKIAGCYRQLFSKNLSFVKLQQNLFENLLNHAIPARDKIKEVEHGIQREFIKTIQDPTSILQLVRDRIETAGFDIQVLFATMNSFYRAESDGIIDLLGAARSRGINVRVLIKIDDETMKDIPKDMIKKKHELINVNFIRQPLRSKITTFIIDQSFSLTVEVNDDSKDNFSEASGLATYSNSESTVFTDYSMFENLWIQAELERQNSIRDAYFKMFKGQKLRDEIYGRDWTVKEK
jgi:two-component system, OmpR family, sensor histidine kinase VicK